MELSKVLQAFMLCDPSQGAVHGPGGGKPPILNLFASSSQASGSGLWSPPPQSQTGHCSVKPCNFIIPWLADKAACHK